MISVSIFVFILLGIAITIGLETKSSQKSIEQTAHQVPQGTRFAEVRKLSSGKKPACLARDTALDKIVDEDDKLPYERSMSTALGTVIPDMPAGHTTTYLHTYTSTHATGYEIFSDKNQVEFVGNLKSFNFDIHRDNEDATWKLTSFIACSE